MANCMRRYRLILEGHDCASRISSGWVRKFLNDLTRRIDMNFLRVPSDNPFVTFVNAATGKEPGYTGAVYWQESGGMVHHWERHKFVTLDMFSCKEFSFLAVEDLFKDYFEPNEIRNCIPVISSGRG